MITSVFFINIKQEIISNLKKANVNIKVAVAWLTDEDIIRVLEQKQLMGVNVQIVVSNSKENFVNTGKFKNYLANNGELYIAHSPFMHNKFCIIDDNIIINGSYNWSYAAIRSEENILLLSPNKEVVEDNSVLQKFIAKYNYLCNKCSYKISTIANLNEFKFNPKDSINKILQLDEYEIELRQEFENDVKRSIDISKDKIKIDYIGLLDRMKYDGGGVNFVKRLLNDEISSGEMKSGFRKLEMIIPHCVELSLEYLVSRPKYRELFSDNEVNFCVDLMKKYNL